MPTFLVKLQRDAVEHALIEVDAKNEIEALNIAFKEIDRRTDAKQDARVKHVELTLVPSKEDPWEEENVEKA